MTTKKKSVGVQLLSKNKTGELVAILQVRAKWNTEKNTPESWPGTCQVTAHGKLEKGENFRQALLREIREELGDEITPIIQTLSNTENLKELVNSDTEEKQIITYGAIIEEDILEKMIAREKSDSFGGFKIIRRNEIKKIIDIQKVDKKTGVTDETVIAMFPDEKEAVRIAFEKFA